jgi:hypothetical protein
MANKRRLRIILTAALGVVITLVVAMFLLLYVPPPPATLDFSRTTEIVIEDGWQGISPTSPEAARYTLSLGEGQFEGHAYFSAGHNPPLHITESITIPQEVVQPFLKALAQSKLEYGTYIVRAARLDDHPRIFIVLKYDQDEISFGTADPKDPYWGVKFNGRDYVVNSDIPGTTLTPLYPYLKRDVYRGLIEEARKQSWP